MATSSKQASNLSEVPVDTAPKYAPAGAILRAGDQQGWIQGESYRNEGKKILEHTLREAENIAASERARGYEEGLNAGSKDLLDLIAQTQSAADEYYKQLEANLPDLVMEIIAEVMDGLDASEAVALAAKKALKEAESRAEITLFVSPSVLRDVKRRLRDFIDSAETPPIAIEPDAGLAEDDCRLVTEFTAVDLSLKRQLGLLGQSLRSACIGRGK